MTDEELKELVASLAVAQRETDAQMKSTNETLKSIGIEISRTDEQMRSTNETLKSVGIEISRTDEQMRSTNETLKSVGIQLGNMSRNQGDVAEEFFFNSLLDDPHLGGIHFDDIAKSQFKHRGNVQEEYDIVMTNGNAVGIIEVKYKAHEKDLDKLERKMKNFKKLFPVYENYKLYGAIASFHLYDDAIENALERGFFVLQRSGNVVQTDCGDNLMVL